MNMTKNLAFMAVLFAASYLCASEQSAQVNQDEKAQLAIALNRIKALEQTVEGLQEKVKSLEEEQEYSSRPCQARCCTEAARKRAEEIKQAREMATAMLIRRGGSFGF